MHAKRNIFEGKLPPPIGTSDWTTFSQDGYCVDKTLLIKELVDARTRVALFTLLYGTGSNGSAWTDLGEGMLDLNGRIFMETESGVRQEMTVVGFNGDAFKGPSYDKVQLLPNARYPRALVMREDLAVVNPQQHFRHRRVGDGGRRGQGLSGARALSRGSERNDPPLPLILM